MDMTRKSLILLLMILSSFLFETKIFCQNQGDRWEMIGYLSPSGKILMEHDEYEISMIATSVEIKVKQSLRVDIFTILGKSVISQNLEPGLYSFTPTKHGLYIIKTQYGSCKVSL